MKEERTFAELLTLIESHRQDWMEHAPIAEHVRVERRTASLTVRLSKEEDTALDAAAKGIGIAKSTLLRIMIRHYLGLGSQRGEIASRVTPRRRSGAVIKSFATRIAAAKSDKSRRTHVKSGSA